VKSEQAMKKYLIVLLVTAVLSIAAFAQMPPQMMPQQGIPRPPQGGMMRDDPHRPVYGVSEWLLDHSHFNLFFVNPRITTLFGFPVYRSLAEVPEWIDIVDVFRNVADMPVVLDESIAVKAKTMWMQLGLVDDVTASRGVQAGLKVVQDRCLKVDYERFIK